MCPLGFQNQKNFEKTKKNKKKQKVQPYVPIGVGSFVFFFWFSRGFFGFLPKVAKTSRKQKKNKKKQKVQPYVPIGVGSFGFFCSFWFSRGFFLVLEGKWSRCLCLVPLERQESKCFDLVHLKRKWSRCMKHTRFDETYAFLQDPQLHPPPWPLLFSFQTMAILWIPILKCGKGTG